VKASIRERLSSLAERHQEISALLSEADVIADQARFRELSREYARLEALATTFGRYQQAERDLDTARGMLEEDDAELRMLAEDEVGTARGQLAQLQTELELLLIPEDPLDQANVFLEIRAGTGGDEAALFSGDLLRMYLRYAEQRQWQTELISASEGEHGGYKEVVARISGGGIYSRLKFESGAHRVQRVPATESQGRIHTSACTVAVLPEADAVGEVEINSGDLRIDTYRASGAGGQHVNKTDSAIRITHLPTGVVVECQDERSQHKNRAKAMALLQARLTEAERQRREAATSAQRKSLVGSGDRSERIRTYNFPQGRVTDHRINLTLYKLDDILQGGLDQVIEPLQREHQADQLADIAGSA